MKTDNHLIEDFYVSQGGKSRITKEQYEAAKRIVDRYEHEEWETNMRLAEEALEEDYMLADEPCPTCGEIDGMVNPCCPGYDPLHYKNCGYG